ncbi:MAG: LacI family transcriptional regulator [Verrucomicrobia bacterium]|nr:LacI family transcriptional regulator [Verrucomicrobiota bacterium]
MNERVTLRDLARITGVHFTTVGLALRNDARISAATAAKVQAAARQYGYTEDAMLSALSTYRHRNSHRFASVIAYITTYDPDEMLKTNVTERTLVEAATAFASSRNFQLELFQINAPEMTAERMSKLLWARNIQGVILSPKLPEAGPMENLAWEHFSTVAIGYSITDLNVHRVCAHQAHNTRLCISKLRERGYRRVGLIMGREVYERSRGHVLGAYLSEQCLHPEAERVSPLFLPLAEITRPRIQHWLRDQRIDALALSSQPLEITAMLAELGYSVPGEIGVALVSRFGKTDHIAGVDERMQALGEAAVDAVINLISHNERGLPEYPRYSLVEGRWIERATVRAMPAILEPIRQAS